MMRFFFPRTYLYVNHLPSTAKAEAVVGLEGGGAQACLPLRGDRVGLFEPCL
jgi:hypothetical protein